MRKVTSEGRFPLEDLVDMGESVDKLNCTQNLRSMLTRVPSLGRLEAINKLTKNKTKYFFYLFIAILFIVIGSLMARVAYKRNRESRHMKLAQEIARMEDPLSEADANRVAIVETLQASDLPIFDVQLASLNKNFDIPDISTFLIVAESDDFIRIRNHVTKANEKYGNKFPIRVVDVANIVPELNYLTKHSEAETAPYYKEHKFGYITRMIVKLAATEWVPGEVYLALDADVVCVKPTSFKSLMQGGKAAVETGKLSFQTAHQWKGAKHVLDAPKSLFNEDTVYGGVPSLYNRHGVYKLKAYLEIVYQQPWKYSLLRYLSGWSDYSLYYSFLRMANLFEKYHTISDGHILHSGGISGEYIDASGWENVDFESTLKTEQSGSFVHLNGVLHAPSEVVNRLHKVFR